MGLLLLPEHEAMHAQHASTNFCSDQVPGAP